MTEQSGAINRRNLIKAGGAVAGTGVVVIGVSAAMKGSEGNTNPSRDSELVEVERDAEGLVLLKEVIDASFPKEVIDSLDTDQISIEDMFGREENMSFPGYPKEKDETILDGFAFKSEITVGKKEDDEGIIYGFSGLLNTWDLEEGRLIILRRERPSDMPLFTPEKGMDYSRIFPDATSMDVNEIIDESTDPNLHSQSNGVRIAGIRDNSSFVAEIRARGNISITTFVPNSASA